MTLENKLGITSSADLSREEEWISKKKALVLFDKGLLNQLAAGTFSSLQFIHKYLFEDIYDFAGELRTVNIAKGSFRFAPVMYLEAAIANIEKMPQSTFDEIVEKYVEMNVAHPFREGNGRSGTGGVRTGTGRASGAYPASSDTARPCWRYPPLQTQPAYVV